jgi:zinc transport system substrate-binding protein
MSSIAGLAACSPRSGAESAKLRVVASFYPVAAAAGAVGGQFVDVTNLTPAGVEPHDLELTSATVDKIENADALFYVGSGFQPAIAAAAKRRGHNTVDVANGLLDASHDPHVWLDPTLMAKIVDRVAAGLDKADPRHAAEFAHNVTAYKAKLTALDDDYKAALAHCTRHEIVTAHAAFFYLARRYGLTQRALTGLSPDAEPDPGRIAELAALIKRESVTTVFYEELVPRDFADTLAHDAGVDTAVLNPIEGLTRRQVQAGNDYFSVMRRNLAALTGALACAPQPT